MYEPTWDSVATHPLPEWYDDAKLGVFLHWGLYSVPGWAPQVPDIQELLRTKGPRAMLYDNPYAEWYRNSMQLEGSPTWTHHRQTYGESFTYDDFIPAFDEGSASADLDGIAELCATAGARYVVLTTKHHEGFTLWPASSPHPTKGAYHARRDIVADLSEAVRARELRMGLYYSGGYDWPFNDAVMKNPADATLAVPDDPAYTAYATAHVRELIDRYRPSVLWNDIAWPAGGNLPELFAHYYNTVADGVINDRWIQPSLPRNAATETLARGAGHLIQTFWRALPSSVKHLTFPSANHYDFNTPEYAQFDEVKEKKWESTRGVGHSFGANRNERPEDIVTATGLVRLLADIVAKNGNLLIGIGPQGNGTIPEEQQVPLRGLGDWLATNGEAIYGTRPWDRAAATTTEATEVRFTQRDGEVFALLLDTPGVRTFGLRNVDATAVSEVRLLGIDEPLEWEVREGTLEVTFPERLPVSAVQVLSLGRGARPSR
ncbi:MAG: alpha-L-fucosidase [Acidimicrobiia bacterium]|nr:alpha-L-fucosidase [Acidimicrobiia bacterium]